MYTKAFLIAAIAAYVEARFNQEQLPVAAVAALSNRGNPGVAATLAGSIPSSLLAAANACARLELADKIVAELGSTQDVIDAARGLVAAEQNFNPFAVSVPKICDNAALPATEALRGIIPKVDPAVVGSDVENANSATSLTNPFPANGLSVAAIMIQQGFSNFTLGETGTPASGGAGAGAGAGAGNNNNNNSGNNNNNNNAGNNNNNNNNAGNNNNNAGNNNNNNNAGNKCGGGNNNNAGNNANTGNNNNANTGNNNNNAGAGAGTAAQKSTIAGLDFGACVPTMKFVGGLGNRPATEFTFQAIDPLVAKGQQEALNPNIITNRICDQLTNVCNANDAAKAACQQAKAEIQALGTRNRATADAWNTALGFAGASTQ